MTHVHTGDGGLLAMLVVAVAVGYEVLATRDRDWSFWRTLSFLTGAALLIAGLTPSTSPWPAGASP